MEKKSSKEDIFISKRKDFDLIVFDKYIAGMCLSGNEIKSIRQKKVNIDKSHILFKNSELYIFEMFIKKYENSNFSALKNEERRPRKLLLKKSEINKIFKLSKEKGFSLFPLKVFLSFGKWAKLEIAIARRKKKHQIKEYQKDKEMKKKIQKKDFF